MKKILYLANQRMPTEKAYGIQIAKMCESFGRRANLELLMPTRLNNIEKDFFAYYGLERNFEIKKVFAPDFYLPGTLDKVAFVVKNFISALILAIHSLLSKADVIYSRDELPLYFLSFFKKRLFFESHRFSKSRLFFYKRFKKSGFKIIVISQGLKNEFLRIGFRPEDILLAHDGVDLDQFNTEISKNEARKKVGLPLDKSIILYAGQLFDWKGTAVLLKAAQRSNGFNTLFVFVGGIGTDVLDFQKKASGLKNVLILGHKPHKEIPLYLRAADVLVLPNSAKEPVSKLYTSPLKLFEYMASKRPIVASGLPSIKEILNDENSILVNSDDPQALAECIKKALTESTLVERLAAKAYEEVKDFTWQKRAEKIFKFIDI